MPQSNEDMGQLFPNSHSQEHAGSWRKLSMSKPIVDWVVPLCPVTHTPPLRR